MAEPWFIVDPRAARAWTNALLAAVEADAISKDTLLEELLRWISESEVEEFCRRCLWLRDDDNQCIIGEAVESLSDEEVESIMDNFGYPGNRSHY